MQTAFSPPLLTFPGTESSYFPRELPCVPAPSEEALPQKHLTCTWHLPFLTAQRPSLPLVNSTSFSPVKVHLKHYSWSQSPWLPPSHTQLLSEAVPHCSATRVLFDKACSCSPKLTGSTVPRVLLWLPETGAFPYFIPTMPSSTYSTYKCTD